MSRIEIFADGACSGNPGPGGYAFEIQADGVRIHGGQGKCVDTTNNRMELEALIEALALIKRLIPSERRGLLKSGTEILLTLDSEYVLKGLFEWMPGWKKNGWRNAQRKPVLNTDLWQTLDELHAFLVQEGYVFTANWVKGHNGNPGNERVDAAAQRMSATARSERDAPATAADVPLSTDRPAIEASPLVALRTLYVMARVPETSFDDFQQLFTSLFPST